MVTLKDEQGAIRVLSEHFQHWQCQPQQLEQLFRYSVRNGIVTTAQIAEVLYIPLSDDEFIDRLCLFQVGEQYYIEIIYKQLEQQCERKLLFALKKYLQQHTTIDYPHMIHHYIEIAKKHFSTDDVCLKLLDIRHHIQANEQSSSRLKTIEIIILLYFFTTGEPYYNFVLRDIARMQKVWKRGHLALTVKERALLAYMSMTIAHNRQQWKKTVDEARNSLKQGRFMEVAVELLIDYGRLLNSTPPAPNDLIKNYRTSILENFFFMYVEALSQLEQYDEALELLYRYEIASTSTIFHYLQQPCEEHLIAIEAAMQQNIALLVDESTSYVKQSLEKWQQQYEALEEAHISSKYMCLILETLFVSEQYELFERLMYMYVKYLKFETHYDCLKQRITVHMALQS